MKLMNINFLSDASDTNKKPDKYFLPYFIFNDIKLIN